MQSKYMHVCTLHMLLTYRPVPYYLFRKIIIFGHPVRNYDAGQESSRNLSQ